MEGTVDENDEIAPETFLDGTLTTILVGEDQKKYHVHKALLCKRVGYFAAAYRTNMQECADDTFRVNDVSDQAFRSLISWLYTGKMFLNSGSQSALQLDEPYPKDFAWDGDDDYHGVPGYTYEDGYDAVSETNSAMDYEYEEESVASEPDDMERGLKHDLEQQYENESVDRLEQRLVTSIFSDALTTDLEILQLRTLLRLAESEGLRKNEKEHICKPFVAKWTAMLEQKLGAEDEADDLQSRHGEEEDEEQPASTFELLMDLYIIADRFDVPILRREVLDGLQAEHDSQLVTLGGKALPSFDVVTKTLKNLPPNSDLRRWLLHIFASRWSPGADTSQERIARERLPQDFVLDLAMTLAERAAWVSEDVVFTICST